MSEWNVAQCPFYGSWHTANVNDDFRQCQICGVAWDRVYQPEGGVLEIHTKRAIVDYLRAGLDQREEVKT